MFIKVDFLETQASIFDLLGGLDHGSFGNASHFGCIRVFHNPVAVSLTASSMVFEGVGLNRQSPAMSKILMSQPKSKMLQPKNQMLQLRTKKKALSHFKKQSCRDCQVLLKFALAELLPSTDANERLKEVSSDRPDPYAFVPVPPPPAAAPPAPEDRSSLG